MQAAILSNLSPSGPPTTSQTVHPSPGISRIPNASAPPGGNPQDDSEAHVTLTFTCMPWDDGSEQLLQRGAIVFCARNTKGTRNNIVSIYKLNEILRQGAAMGKEYLGWGAIDSTVNPNNKTLRRIDGDEKNPMNDPSSLKRKFQNLKEALKGKVEMLPPSEMIAFVGSDCYFQSPDRQDDIDAELENIRVFKTMYPEQAKDADVLKAFYPMDKMANDTFNNLVQFYVDQRDTTMRYLSVESIRRFWNFLGVVNNTNRGKEVQLTPAAMSGTGQIRPIRANVIVQRRCVVPNIWGDGVNESSHLYLVLTREYLGKDEWDDYQVVPWFSNNQGERPPPSLLLHRDYQGNLTRGIDIYFGKVNHRNNGMAPVNTRRCAAGLRPKEGGTAPSTQRAWEQNGSLDTLDVDLKMFQ